MKQYRIAIAILSCLGMAAGCASTTDPASGGGAGGMTGGSSNAGMGGKLAGGAAGVSGRAGSSGIPVGANLCQGEPVTGRCEGNVIVKCLEPNGSRKVTAAQRRLVMLPCDANETCSVVDGQAQCVLGSGACEEGTTRCSPGATMGAAGAAGASAGSTGGLQQCTGGKWVDQTCATKCVPSPVGAVCQGQVTTGGSTTQVGLVDYTATATYEFLDAKADLSDWDPALQVDQVRRALVVSRRGGQVVDVAETDETGAFTIKVPSPAQAGDDVTIMAVRAKDAAMTAMKFAVAAPKMAEGEADPMDVKKDKADFWQWSFDLTDASHASGSTLKIPLKHPKDGYVVSAAMRVFAELRFAYDAAAVQYGKEGRTLVIFLPEDVTWTCGACAMYDPVDYGPFKFQSQMFLPFNSDDQSYWSTAVIQHELGHWVMGAFGRPPYEAGLHCIGKPVFPGMAWSEGWATFYSSVARNDSVYYDKQSGTFFYVDIDARKYSMAVWERPKPADGLFQLIDENEVSAMLWKLTEAPASSDAGTRIAENQKLLTTLATKRMTSQFDDDVAKTRKYTAKQWAYKESGCVGIDWQWDTEAPAPTVADYFDSLICDGVRTEAQVSDVTNPTTAYPFSHDKALCSN